MEKFFKSKFFVFIVALTLSLVIIPLIFSAMGISSPIRSIINVVLTPVQKLAQTMSDSVAGFASYFSDFDELVKENESLKKQLSDLREQIEDADEIKGLNDWLYNYLELKRLHKDFSFLNATITGRSSNNYSTSFTLDKGSVAGVTVSMPVVTEDGVVGYVSEVGLNWCKVKTILDSSSAVGVKIKRNGAIGVAESSYELSKEGKCKISYLAPETDIRVGDLIVTSGFSELYPEGLELGVVSSIEPDPYSRSVVAVVTLSASIDKADFVMILFAYE